MSVDIRFGLPVPETSNANLYQSFLVELLDLPLPDHVLVPISSNIHHPNNALNKLVSELCFWIASFICFRVQICQLSGEVFER